MKPQNKITIFMVVMIVMLSIYYFTLGNDDSKEANKTKDPNNTEVFRYEEYELLRAQLNEERENLINELRSVIVSADVSVSGKNDALNTINKILAIKNNEYGLELKLRKSGYLDAFVSTSNNEVLIRVLDTEYSYEESRDLMIMGSAQFGTKYKVVVQFDPIADEENMY